MSKCNVILYSNSADKRVVNKTDYITEYKKLEGYFRDEVSLLTPTFQVECDSVPNCNYCYIDVFNRYYYIKSVRLIRNRLYEFNCSVDVLMTYKSYISDSTQYVSRQENKYNELLVDSYVTFNDDYEFTIKEQHLDFLDYANKDFDNYSMTEKTNIVLSTICNTVSFEV